MAIFNVETRNVEVLHPPDADSYGVTIVRRNAAEVNMDGQWLALAGGTLHVADPRIPFELRVRDPFDCLVIRVDRELVDRHVGFLSDAARSKLVVRPGLDSRSPAGAALVGYAEFLWRELQQECSPFLNPLVAAEAAHTAAALIADNCIDPQNSTEPDSGTALVMRAEEFLLGHLTSPVSAPDVAEHVGVSVRSLSRGFHARHGMGPIAFLRARRFEAVKAALRRATASETSVTEVALRHGFSHLGRFSVEYRRRFGESPSQTLAQ